MREGPPVEPQMSGATPLAFVVACSLPIAIRARIS